MKKTLVFAFFLAISVLVPAMADPLPDKPHIYVEGSAEIEVAPDQMIITIGLSHTDPDVAIAKKEVDERSTILIDACKDIGIDMQDLATTALHVSPAYEYHGGERIPLGTRVYRQVDITLRNLEKYPALMAALIEADISNTVSTRLEVSNEKTLSDRALVAAIEDARKRAEAMAESLGKDLGEAHSISEFDLRRDERNQLFTVRGIKSQPSSGAPELAFARSAAGEEPFVPGLIVARAQVYVVFLIR